MTNTVTVTAIGSATGTPDKAIAHITVTCSDSDIAAALTKLSAATFAVQEVTATYRLAPEQCSTVSTNLSPQHDPQQWERIVGYQAQQSLALAVTSLTYLGSLLSDLVAKIGSELSIDQVVMSLSNPAPLADIARKNALLEAQRQATQLAEWSGCKLGKVITLEEVANYIDAAPSVRMMTATSEAIPQFAPGSQQINVTLKASYQLC
ncbi:MAG: SIMPL domain-containing protein [Propionibacteriaceae bacterium]